MFDSRLRPLIDPPLNAIGSALARTGISANQVGILGNFQGLKHPFSTYRQWISLIPQRISIHQESQTLLVKRLSHIYGLVRSST